MEFNDFLGLKDLFEIGQVYQIFPSDLFTLRKYFNKSKEVQLSVRSSII